MGTLPFRDFGKSQTNWQKNHKKYHLTKRSILNVVFVFLQWAWINNEGQASASFFHTFICSSLVLGTQIEYHLNPTSQILSSQVFVCRELANKSMYVPSTFHLASNCQEMRTNSFVTVIMTWRKLQKREWTSVWSGESPAAFPCLFADQYDFLSPPSANIA